MHLEYDNGRDDNNSSAFTLLYSMYNLFFKSLSFLIVNATDIHFAKTREKIVCHNVQFEKVETV